MSQRVRRRHPGGWDATCQRSPLSLSWPVRNLLCDGFPGGWEGGRLGQLQTSGLKKKKKRALLGNRLLVRFGLRSSSPWRTSTPLHSLSPPSPADLVGRLHPFSVPLAFGLAVIGTPPLDFPCRDRCSSHLGSSHSCVCGGLAGWGKGRLGVVTPESCAGWDPMCGAVPSCFVQPHGISAGLFFFFFFLLYIYIYKSMFSWWKRLTFLVYPSASSSMVEWLLAWGPCWLSLLIYRTTSCVLLRAQKTELLGWMEWEVTWPDCDCPQTGPIRCILVPADRFVVGPVLFCIVGGAQRPSLRYSGLW